MSENFYDHIHPTELGAKKIAKLTSQYLEREIIKFKFLNQINWFKWEDPRQIKVVSKLEFVSIQLKMLLCTK